MSRKKLSKYTSFWYWLYINFLTYIFKKVPHYRPHYTPCDSVTGNPSLVLFSITECLESKNKMSLRRLADLLLVIVFPGLCGGMRVVGTDPALALPVRTGQAEILDSAMWKYPEFTICARFRTHQFSWHPDSLAYHSLLVIPPEGDKYIQHSHWSRSYNTWLSLVECFRVLKYFHAVSTPPLLCHKEPFRKT